MWITESAKKGRRMKDMYSISGVDVFIKDKLPEHIDAEFVFKYISSRVPAKMIDGVDIIYIGKFPYMDEKGFNAYYEDGAIYVTNEQDDDRDMIEDIVHEIAHACEEMYHERIYGDGRIFSEFKKRRQVLGQLLNELYDDVPHDFETKMEYDEDIDKFLYETIGYDILNQICIGIFISAYAATSINEYFARGFEEFFLGNGDEVKSMHPKLYDAIQRLTNMED
tara:strand:+ start:2488 stop:3156 length:669 start_codon:yes stop_codon:yes gene_type:complete